MPISEDSWVQAKHTRFHANMANTFFSHCSGCNESFPSIKLVDPLLYVHVIAVQARDKREPKLSSAANNMNPGPVPPALQGLTQRCSFLLHIHV